VVSARVTAELGALEKTRPSLASPPPGVPEGGLWREYVAYWERRVAELSQERAAPVPPESTVRPPLTWLGYQELRGAFARGLEFQRRMTDALRAQAAVPPDQRTQLREFRSPRVEQNVAVTKGQGLRFADQLVIEAEPVRGQAPRVETFSCKSRDLRALPREELKRQVRADALEAMQKYGGTLGIRRSSIHRGEGHVDVSKVHLVYDAQLKPVTENGWTAFKEAVDEVRRSGVEVQLR
jgi:hypothetical protein